MSNFIFGPASSRNRDTCHPTLIILADESLKFSPYDFSLIEGRRSIERQQFLYNKRDKNGDRLTHIDGVTQRGKHNYDPSLAFDFQPWPTKIDGVSCWDEEGQWRFYVIGGVILATAKRLDIRARSGQDWDGDGSKRDQTLQDLPHIEIY